MKDNFTNNNCPRCGSPQLKNWSNLSFEEKILAEKTALAAHYTADERKRHLYCTRCWHEETKSKLLNI